jgi:hypothetical protein
MDSFELDAKEKTNRIEKQEETAYRGASGFVAFTSNYQLDQMKENQKG